jgi:hypothetical protein
MALPEGGFDWSFAAREEGTALHSVLTEIANSRNPKTIYEKWFGDGGDAGFQVPTPKELDQLDHVMTRYAQLLSMPPERAELQLAGFQNEIARLDNTSRAGIPNPARMLAQRAAIVKAQNAAIAALGSAKAAQ